MHRSKKTIYGRPFKADLYKIEEKKGGRYRGYKNSGHIIGLNDLIKQKDITVNEAAVRSGVPLQH